jgi:hypothetical protein
VRVSLAKNPTFEENGKKCIEIQQLATTPCGEVSAFGTSSAELPSKG